MDKGSSSQSYDFSSSYVWRESESWIIKKAECRRIDAFELLGKTLESPLDCKEIGPGCSLEGLMLKLKLQYFGHHMQRADSLEKTLMLGLGTGGEGDDRG